MRPLDASVLAVYLLVVVGIGVVVSRRTHSGDDLFLADRSLGWIAIGLSLFASNISSTTLVGLTGAAYRSGIAVANYEWMAAPILVLMAVVFIPLYLRHRITTVPEYLERRFSPTVRRYFSALTLALSVVVDTAGGLYAGALVLGVFFPGLPIAPTCAGLAIFAGLYTAAGGLRAVVWTDAIQAVILLAGSIALTWQVIHVQGGDLGEALAAVPPDHLHLLRPLDDPDLPWLGTLIGVPVLGFWYWATNQYITQRVLAARDLNHARWGALLGGALKLLPLFVMVLPGALAIRLFPDLAQPDQVFPTLVRELLPPGLTGLVLAGLIAAIMSSIDSTLNSASTLVVHDFIRPRRPGLTQQDALRFGRRITLLLMVFAAAWAPMIAHLGGLFDYLQRAFAIAVPPVAAIFLLGALTGRGDGRAALWTLIIGHTLGALLFIAGELGLWPLHYTVTAGLTTTLCALLFLGLARHAAPIDPESGQIANWSRAMARPDGHPGRLRDYRPWAILILLATAAQLLWLA